jgi:hypothetical protein
LSSPNFAVVGASKDQTKFGTKVDFCQYTTTSDSQPRSSADSSVVSSKKLQSNSCSSCELIYCDRGLPPPTWSIQKETELEGLATVTSLKELASPSTTSVSVVTPAKASGSDDI